ncbi:sensor histidine kinase [Haloimpatiens massiliensis]|uniref:sensor histidine kinase n=1 Tax=Haloimpatiens massiliensis TaxID=1658110 RepID=UPI000C836F21|nr:HAMP domain-containing sensor histidine kinase [Haloimpatiens massiliensis]
MTRYIKREPLLKKVLFIGMTILIINNLIVFYVHFATLNLIHKQHMEFSQELIGKMVNISPEKENEIVKTFFNEGNKKDINDGKKILDKYGYETEIKMWEDVTFRKYFCELARYDFISMILLTVVVICVLTCAVIYFIKKVDKISIAVDSIMDNNFKLNLEDNVEGVFSELSSKIKQMSKALQYNFANLKKEKENIKSLVTDISHQLKTPLASIKLFNSLLIEEELTKGEIQEFLFRSKQEINKLEWLFNSLLKISRMEAGMIELKKELKDIKSTLLRAISEVFIKAQEKNIEINAEEIHSVLVCHDPKWTKEAIFNILENSVKYTENNGHIVITTELMESYLRIDIEDNGIGIPKEEFNDIFKRFYRGKSQRVKYCEGSGVGLYLTRKIFEEQGGSIMVDSMEGRGTKFSLYLQNCK